MPADPPPWRDAGPRRREVRDWVVDTGLFVFAVAFGMLTAAERLATATLDVPMWVFHLDQVVGVLGCAALWARRRRPVELAVVLVVLSAYSELVAGAMLVALFTVAVHRAVWTSLAVFTLSLVAGLVYVLLRPDPELPRLVLFLLGFAFQGAAVGWGLFVHHRRRLIASLRESAARTEAEAQQRAREAIAREIHDVLGHRLSLLSVHAGALEFHPHASAEDISSAARVIRQSAHQALQDLREVIGVLRAPVGELPQPTLADVGELVADSRRAGMPVTLSEEVAGPVPERAGRTAYRVVQEALTNARKHAPGAEASVRLAGAPGRGLTIEVRNSPAASPRAGGGGPGLGLAGLGERVALDGGRLEHGPAPDGGWRVTARLPWPATA
ncbi:two-component sensor histidine kinase [Microtetraspora sp. NBRC 13810]|uniref:sensor histidine kinase n=1 Tax=Microtetraspora sp. NBRC 13810 TaxID=3030990 RepID=UPI0024A50CE6|nr:histidine kinase [Microtetraspora sp. NBRC 13810]GLW05199.1 two-component sensor histidine kinase [Microtetraspora sp. NBRC 13810]